MLREPQVGDTVADRARPAFRAEIVDIFPSGAYPGMILQWTGYNPSTDTVGRRAQAFTMKDFAQHWKVVNR
jgi:hypothetical protein